MKTTTGTIEACCVTAHAQWVWLCAKRLLLHVGVSELTQFLKDWLDCWRIDSNKIESVNIEWNVAHDQVNSFALGGFFVIVLTIESNVARIESILSTINLVFSIELLFSIESILSQSSRFYYNGVGFFNRVNSEHSWVDSHNRVDSGVVHNAVFGLKILKQTACHIKKHCTCP